MAKLNLVKTWNQIQEEAFTPLQTHPFYGLRDGKGWLTRYPIPEEEGEFFISRELAADLCFYGVNFDVNSVWGVSPYLYPNSYYYNNNLFTKVIEVIGIEGFARLYKEAGRVDEISELIINLNKNGYYIDPEISLQDLKILARGTCTHYSGASKFGVKTPPPMTWGRWGSQRQLKFVAKKLAIRNKEKLSSSSIHNTSIGEILEIVCVSGKTLLYSFFSGEKLELKTFRNTKVCLAEGYGIKTYFAWREGFSFGDHVEGNSLREAIEKLKERKSIAGLSMSLRMIWEQRAFCFQGTLSFLEDRMPHVARLISEYFCWEDVPSDILDIIWDLDSRDIFKGYPQP